MSKPHGSSGPAADSDLDDLLKESGSPSKVTQNAYHSAAATASSSSRYTYADRHHSYYSQNGGLGCIGAIGACCWLSFQSSPKCGWLCTLLGVSALIYALVYLIDPVEEVGMPVTHDWTSIGSTYDLKAGDIDHWCLMVSSVFRFCMNGGRVIFDTLGPSYIFLSYSISMPEQLDYIRGTTHRADAKIHCNPQKEANINLGPKHMVKTNAMLINASIPGRSVLPMSLSWENPS